MARMAKRDSIDTLGLVVVKHAIEPDPKAECVGHFPTHVVESLHEIEDGETVGELLARLGLDEGDRIEIRFPTVAEDRDRLAEEVAKSFGITNARIYPNGACLAIRDDEGRIVGVPESAGYEDSGI